MIVFGVGEIIGGLLMGKIVDYLGPRKTVFINIAVIFIMACVTCGAIYIERFTYLSFAMTFCWGV